MTNIRQDFAMTALSQKVLYFTLSDSGSPLDLTAASIVWRLSDSPNGAALLEKTNATLATGIIVTNPAQGLCTVTIASGDIADPGLYWHNMTVTIAGVAYAVASGRGVVSPAVGPAS